MSIQERVYSANEYADAQDRICSLEEEVERLRKMVADRTTEIVGVPKEITALESVSIELARCEQIPYREFWPIRDGHWWRTRACLAEAEVERLNKVIQSWGDIYAHAVTEHKHELAEYRVIITKLGHRLGCLKKRRKRELALYQKFLTQMAVGRTDGGKALVEHRLAEIEDGLYRLYKSLRGGPLMVRCVHCAASFTGTVPDTHWRTCPKHPARLEVEQLNARLEFLEGKP